MKWAAARNKDPKPDVPPSDVPPHRTRKDRRRWCRGKPGVEHVQVVRYNRMFVERRDYPVVIPGGRRATLTPRKPRPLCSWVCWWKVERRTDGTWSIPDRWRWSCSHEIGCSVCGKRLEYVHGPDCPDFRPLTGADVAEAKPRKWRS